jgi:hypothetical protein
MMAALGICRGTLHQDFTTGMAFVLVDIQYFDTSSAIWRDASKQITAYPGLPIGDTIPSGTPVWMFYLFNNYFVVLAGC